MGRTAGGGLWSWARLLLLVPLLLLLVFLSAVDVDGDPTTSNLPSVVLLQDSNVASERRSCLDLPAHQPCLSFPVRIRRWIQSWVTLDQLLDRPFRLSIRGP